MLHNLITHKKGYVNLHNFLNITKLYMICQIVRKHEHINFCGSFGTDFQMEMQKITHFSRFCFFLRSFCHFRLFIIQKLNAKKNSYKGKKLNIIHFQFIGSLQACEKAFIISIHQTVTAIKKSA